MTLPEDEHDADYYETNDATPANRVARRRPAGPVRHKIAANDDVPSIGGLIYALEQKPSNAVFRHAAMASGIWAALGLVFAIFSFANEPAGMTWLALLARPATFITFAGILVPIAVFWFLALLSWRAEELRLRSSTMTEVAVRLAEPDRMAEDSIASLGQAVRRQVGFMNEAVGRALGRAGELEALVHNEVSALEASYEENELRIRGLIKELAGEREALSATSTNFNDTLRTLGSEVPQLIEKLSNQQSNLARIIQGAAENLTALESTLGNSIGSLETQLGGRTHQLQGVLETYTGALGTALGTRTEQLRGLLESHTGEVNEALQAHTGGVRQMLDHRAGELGSALGMRTEQMQKMLEAYTGALASALGSRTDQMQSAFATHMKALDTAIANRTNNLQTVFEEYARALDTTLATRSEHLDMQIVERTRALDSSFKERLRLFDESIERSTHDIDRAVEERTGVLAAALRSHADTFTETISRQTLELDEQLSQGIVAVRRTSENITRQSLKAIETLTGQSELLKDVSENLLTQIHTVTDRFETQGQTIVKAANALETANSRIDRTLQARHTDLANTLERLDLKAGEFGRYITDYTANIEGSISDAEARARAAADQLRIGTDTHRQQALSEIERLKAEADEESARALDALRSRLSTVSDEMSSQLGSLSNRFDQTSEEVRKRTQHVADELAREQNRMTAELDRLPRTTRESADAMRRALQDQLKALDQLSSLTTREAHRRDVTLPAADGGALQAAPSPTPTPPATVAPRPAEAHSPPPRTTAAAPPRTQPGQRTLSSLTASLAEELSARGRPAASPPGDRAGVRPAAPPPAGATAAPAPPPPPTASAPTASDPRDAWSLGDLLKRASRDDDTSAAAKPAPMPRAGTPYTLNIEVLSQALDTATAGAIWSRLRSGQHGIMVRSLYSTEGRGAFEELQRRYPADASLQGTVNRYLADFERILRDAEAKDSTGRLARAHMTSAMGRVYLVLAHASGRIT
ncbi:MAG: hypothetical protein AB7E80_03695 [Hyphomicrobiaceae bacterium]